MWKIVSTVNFSFNFDRFVIRRKTEQEKKKWRNSRDLNRVPLNYHSCLWKRFVCLICYFIKGSVIVSMSCQGMMFANNTNELVQVSELHEDLICQSQTPHRTFSFQLSDLRHALFV